MVASGENNITLVSVPILRAGQSGKLFTGSQVAVTALPQVTSGASVCGSSYSILCGILKDHSLFVACCYVVIMCLRT